MSSTVNITRLSREGASLLFDNTSPGVAVRIVDDWKAAGLMVANN